MVHYERIYGSLGLSDLERCDWVEDRGNAGMFLGAFHRPRNRAPRAIRSGPKDSGRPGNVAIEPSRSGDSHKAFSDIALALWDNLLQAPRHFLEGLQKGYRSGRPNGYAQGPDGTGRL